MFPFNLYTIGFIAIIIAGLGVAHTVDKNHAIALNTASVTASLTKEYQSKLDTAVIEAITKTKQLQEATDTLKEKKYADLQTINKQLSDDYRGLQQRTKRPTSPPINADNPISGETCTARELYREDAEFLTGEAARAESVLVERDYYYNQYENIRSELMSDKKDASKYLGGMSGDAATKIKERKSKIDEAVDSAEGTTPKKEDGARPAMSKKWYE